MVANRARQWSRAYRPGRHRCFAAIVTTTGLFDNSMDLLGNFDVFVGDGVEPGQATSTIRALVDECRNWTG